MADVTFALAAKSDQTNAVDILGVEPVIRIREVQVKTGDQPVSVFYDGDNNRPWKPSKGMLRILAGAWGRESAGWVGKSVQIYCEPTVKYAGQEVGGIRIRALSDIPAHGLQFVEALNRKQRQQYHVKFLEVSANEYPADHFEKAFPTMAKKMQAGEMTLQQIIAQCQKKGQLTADQLARLEQSAPVEIHESDDEVM